MSSGKQDWVGLTRSVPMIGKNAREKKAVGTITGPASITMSRAPPASSGQSPGKAKDGPGQSIKVDSYNGDPRTTHCQPKAIHGHTKVIHGTIPRQPEVVPGQRRLSGQPEAISEQRRRLSAQPNEMPVQLKGASSQPKEQKIISSNQTGRRISTECSPKAAFGHTKESHPGHFKSVSVVRSSGQLNSDPSRRIADRVAGGQSNTTTNKPSNTSVRSPSRADNGHHTNLNLDSWQTAKVTNLPRIPKKSNSSNLIAIPPVPPVPLSSVDQYPTKTISRPAGPAARTKSVTVEVEAQLPKSNIAVKAKGGILVAKPSTSEILQSAKNNSVTGGQKINTIVTGQERKSVKTKDRSPKITTTGTNVPPLNVALSKGPNSSASNIGSTNGNPAFANQFNGPFHPNNNMFQPHGVPGNRMEGSASFNGLNPNYSPSINRFGGPRFFNNQCGPFYPPFGPLPPPPMHAGPNYPFGGELGNCGNWGGPSPHPGWPGPRPLNFAMMGPPRLFGDGQMMHPPGHFPGYPVNGFQGTWPMFNNNSSPVHGTEMAPENQSLTNGSVTQPVEVKVGVGRTKVEIELTKKALEENGGAPPLPTEAQPPLPNSPPIPPPPPPSYPFSPPISTRTISSLNHISSDHPSVPPCQTSHPQISDSQTPSTASTPSSPTVPPPEKSASASPKESSDQPLETNTANETMADQDLSSKDATRPGMNIDWAAKGFKSITDFQDFMFFGIVPDGYTPEFLRKNVTNSLQQANTSGQTAIIKTEALDNSAMEMVEENSQDKSTKTNETKDEDANLLRVQIKSEVLSEDESQIAEDQPRSSVADESTTSKREVVEQDNFQEAAEKESEIDLRSSVQTSNQQKRKSFSSTIGEDVSSPAEQRKRVKLDKVLASNERPSLKHQSESEPEVISDDPGPEKTTSDKQKNGDDAQESDSSSEHEISQEQYRYKRRRCSGHQSIKKRRQFRKELENKDRRINLSLITRDLPNFFIPALYCNLCCTFLHDDSQVIQCHILSRKHIAKLEV